MDRVAAVAARLLIRGGEKRGGGTGSWGCDGAERQTETATADAAGDGAAGQQHANTQVRK